MNKELKELIDSLSIFRSFLQIAEVMNENGEFEKPFTEFSIVSHLEFGGGSITLDIGNFRRMEKAITDILKLEGN